VTIVDTLPPGLAVVKVKFILRYNGKKEDFGEKVEVGGEEVEVCEQDVPADPETESTVVECTLPGAEFPGSEELLPGVEEIPSLIRPGEELLLEIQVEPTAAIHEGDALRNKATVECNGFPTEATVASNRASASEAPAGFAQFEAALLGADGQPIGQAGSHPEKYITSYAVNDRHKLPGAAGPDFVPAGGDMKDVRVALPPGLAGNPTATPRCTLAQFNTLEPFQPFPAELAISGLQRNQCPIGSAVGYVTVRLAELPTAAPLPIYNLVPPPGEPAQLGFHLVGAPILIDTAVRNGADYGVDAFLRNVNESKQILSAAITLWGEPGDPSHDSIRGECLNSETGAYPIDAIAAATGHDCPAGVSEKPFLRLPTDCAAPLPTTFELESWLGTRQTAFSQAPAPLGCAALRFEPSLRARPSTDVADSPSGLDVDLHLPQAEPAGLGEADLRKAEVKLPPGLVINPSGANGLGSCSESQVGHLGKFGGTDRFSTAPADCPDAAKIGTAEVDTPLIDHPLPGAVYLATPHHNPFDTLLAIYLVAEDSERGVVIKQVGHVEPDPGTGRLKITFDETPQMPLEDLELRFFDGPKAALRTPATCGARSTTSELTPWSAPASGPPATPSDSYSINRNPSADPCPTSAGALPNSPAFEAGTVVPLAGAYSPLVVNLRREDGSQELSSLSFSPPPGLLARLAGIPYCPDAAIAAARSSSGRAEQASPSCPEASRVGSARLGAGAGPKPYYTSGDVYLAGPYEGAPVSLAILAPAVAGPFDLGTVVVRTALHVDPASARIAAITGPFPRILAGIVLDLRSIALRIDRPAFTLNPTSCEPSLFGGGAFTALGQPTTLASRFQVGECARLGFRPRLKIRLLARRSGRGAFPRLRVVLRPRDGDANARRIAVLLPGSELLENAHFRTICTRAQFAAGGGLGAGCPRGAVYGRVRAWTPLLDAPLEGPVYLRSSERKLPDLVLALHGLFDLELVGRVDSVRGRIRVVFAGIPDAPLSHMVLNMRGGRKGLLVNSTDLCRGTHRARVRLAAHNARRRAAKPRVSANCKKARKKGKKRGAKGKKQGHKKKS
jgi:hypothetical protein